MKVITIINFKGGAAKTTTTVNLAAELAGNGKRVAVIDADPQANASRFYNLKGRGCTTLTDLMEGRINDPEALLYETDFENVWCVPADIGLVNLDIAAVRQEDSLIGRYLPDFCHALREEELFDVVLIDCPPGFTAASVSAISTSDQIILPVTPEVDAVSGMDEMLAQIRSARRVNSGMRARAVMCNWDKSILAAELAELLRGAGVPVYPVCIRHSDAVKEALAARRPIRSYSPHSYAARDYKAFGRAVLEEVE